MTQKNEEKKNLIYEDLVENFKNTKLQGTKRNKKRYSILPKYA